MAELLGYVALELDPLGGYNLVVGTPIFDPDDRASAEACLDDHGAIGEVFLTTELAAERPCVPGLGGSSAELSEDVQLLRAAKNLDGTRRFYPPYMHPATYRYRAEWHVLLRLPESPERDELMAHIEAKLAAFEKYEDWGKRQYLRAVRAEHG